MAQKRKATARCYTDSMIVKDLPFCEELCHLLPKVDLHRHLTGSLPNLQVQKILQTIAPELSQDALLITPDVLDKSPEAHKAAWDLLVKQCNAVRLATCALSTSPSTTSSSSITTSTATSATIISSNPKDLQNLRYLTTAAICALREDNIMYCEFRIGLKDEPTKREYLNTLIEVIKAQEAVNRFPIVSLLLSVARHGDIKVGDDSVDIAQEYRKQEVESKERPIVCGIELGGVVTAGAWVGGFDAIFTKAKAANIPVALHCGEDLSKQAEWSAMIEFRPDRLGHCVYLDEENLSRVKNLKIPVETCFTCHKRVFDTPMHQNIFGKLFPAAPVTLATDNPSFYAVTLSEEYVSCCRNFNLTLSQLFILARQGLDYSFMSTSLRTELLAWFDKRVEELKAKFCVENDKSKL